MRGAMSGRAGCVLLLAMMLVASTGVATSPAAAEGNESPGAPAAFRALSSGAYSTCAIRTNGSVKCWGANFSGQLGLGDTNNRGDTHGEMGANLPSVALGTGRTATAVTAGSEHACALLDNATVKCWGQNQWGQLGRGDTASRGDNPNEMGDSLAPINLGTGRTATAVSAGSEHTCALLDNATVKCWGISTSGQLGQGNTATRGDNPNEMGDSLAPISLGEGRTATAIAAGGSHTCALLDNATVKCWGLGFALGLGSTFNRGAIPGDLGNNLAAVDLGPGRTATALTAGGYTTCALLDDGTVKCWGGNDVGQLGLGDTATRGDAPGEMGSTLTAVDLGAGRTALAVATSGDHTCALLDDGDLKCWGNGVNGPLGLGDASTRGDGPDEMGDDLPTVDVGTGRTVTAVTTGAGTTCARLDDASIKCWGESNLGQLGLGDNASRGDEVGEMGDNLPPVPVPPVDVAAPANDAFASATTLAAGTSILNLSTVGATREAGEPNHAGGGAGASVWFRFTAPGPGTASIDTSGSGFDTLLAVYKGSSVSSLTQLAANDDDGGPQSRVEFELESGKTYRIAVDGRAGVAGALTLHTDVDLLGPLAGIEQLAAGPEMTCAVLVDTTARCWGRGPLGNGVSLSATSAVPVTVLDGTGSAPLTGVTQIAIGAGHVCAVLTDATGVCWGENLVGELGDGTLTQRLLPVLIQRPGGGGPLTDIAELSAGDFRTCARLAIGEARCWGQNLGAIGDGTMTNRKRPVAVRNSANTANLTNVAEVVTGSAVTCARLVDRTARCWGADQGGLVGDGTTRIALLPRTVRNPANTAALGGVTDLDHTGSHVCARVTGGEARCWGSNRSGQIGDGTVTLPGQADKLLPRAVLATSGTARLTGVARLGVGTEHSCAVLSTGQARCWGANGEGQAGDGSTTRRPRARVVRNVGNTAALSGVADIVGGGQHTCALLTDATAVCWGANDGRQLGDGTSTRRTTPVRLLGV